MSCKWCGGQWVEVYSDNCSDCGEVLRWMQRYPDRAKQMVDSLPSPEPSPPKGGV